MTSGKRGPAPRWTPEKLAVVVENARELAEIGGETIDQAVRRIDGVPSVGSLEKILRDAGAHDVIRRFTANRNRPALVRQGLIR